MKNKKIKNEVTKTKKKKKKKPVNENFKISSPFLILLMMN